MGRSNSASYDGAVASVAFATALSRVAGFFRDSVMFALLGMSPWSGAFLFAFTVPNLFRRMLGEGALSSAMIPIFTETLETRSREDAFAFLNRLLTRLGALIFVLCAVFLLLFVIMHKALSPSWLRALALSAILCPYLAFACLSAAICGALNSLGSFGLPALNAALLNGAMIVFGVVGLLLCPSGGATAALLLCGGVLLGGLCQLALPFWLLMRSGWRFHFDWSSSQLLAKMMALLIPAAVGAAMVQINATLSRILAFWLTDNGIGILYMSSRLVELPLGIFVASIVAVTFPSLSRSAGSGDCRSFSDGYVRAQRSLAMVTIPSAIGLILLGRPILILLFAWGNCAVSDLDQVLPALQISAAAIPFFASAGLLARVFHARQDMKSPMVVAAISIVANIIFTLILIGPFGATGMAAANSVSAMLQCALLRRKMEKRFGKMDCAFGSKWPLLWASLVLVLLILFVGAICGQPTSKCGILLWIAVTIPLAAIAYGTVLWLLGFGEVSLLLALVRPPKRRQFSH